MTIDNSSSNSINTPDGGFYISGGDSSINSNTSNNTTLNHKLTYNTAVTNKTGEKPHQIMVSGLAIDVVRKDIKNLHLGVYPPAGRVRVAAPLRVNDEAVRLFVISKLGWIKRQQAEFINQERQSAREFVTGESHYFQGNRYLLNVIYQDAPPKVVVSNKTRLDLFVRSGATTSQREQVLLNWYRQELKEQIPPLIAKWERVVGVKVAEWCIKQMKTKWGTCKAEEGRIWLNLALVKKPIYCLEYVIVHEMVHLLERHHNDKFTTHLSIFMPQWRYYRDELNRAPLSYEIWDYLQ